MIILIGPSASGKTAVGKLLEQKFNIKKVVTYTTRPMRLGEIDGVDYNFLSKEEFIEKRNNNFFFETMTYSSNYYGTSIESLSNNSYMILDLNGYQKYLESSIKFSAYYLKCDKEIRRKRMILRCDSNKSIEERLKNDDAAFNLSQIKFEGLVIDTSNITLDEIASIIIDDYRGENGR